MTAPPNYPPDLLPGVVSNVADGVARVIAPNPSIMTGPGTNTYAIGDGAVVLIDPGPDDDVHHDRLLELYGDRLRALLVTHSHLDHSPLASRLAAATGAPVIGFGPPPRFVTDRLSAGLGDRHHLDGHDQTFSPDRRMSDGDRLDCGDFSIEAVWTPGHTSNHLCFELAGTGLLFSGDHVMSGSTVVIAPPDGDMSDYFESLEKVRARSPRRIGPGHGAMIDDPASVLDGYLRHRTERERQVEAGVAAAGSNGISVEALVKMIYTDVPEVLHPVARYSVWAHLRKLGVEGRATCVEPDDISAIWNQPVATAF